MRDFTIKENHTIDVWYEDKAIEKDLETILMFRKWFANLMGNTGYGPKEKSE